MDRTPAFGNRRPPRPATAWLTARTTRAPADPAARTAPPPTTPDRRPSLDLPRLPLPPPRRRRPRPRARLTLTKYQKPTFKNNQK